MNPYEYYFWSEMASLMQYVQSQLYEFSQALMLHPVFEGTALLVVALIIFGGEILLVGKWTPSEGTDKGLNHGHAARRTRAPEVTGRCAAHRDHFRLEVAAPRNTTQAQAHINNVDFRNAISLESRLGCIDIFTN